ncbi:hypothetical protein G6F46_000309 [Rhizopus delemar]|uniref:Xylanolytic transcriptional activator regulatory domain-containing protein n=2 Tax=Rhizopus TaxID=4842 RepID=A0A9P6ZE75_9FUNG|nr:hypothetical protein G6F55_000068 [Rhizopus delemar]KAG1553777.1 hypothetical protein G6F51_000384 [Rhizopus arrhizus]KAG1505533.1 hypothetical protein G6F54_000252 [Rhizopus delemar]KAG1518888.1 hypothetical protein G6F53_000229 [Rhizopus delemar]KAG1523654.1 hypothetical protein G6F52_004844 [Rhizopus delemar]
MDYRQLAAERRKRIACNNCRQERLAKVEHTITCSPEQKEKLPQEYLINHLLDLYFNHLGNQALLTDLEKLKRSVRENTCDRFLLYSLMSVAARYSKREELETYPYLAKGARFADIATSMINEILMGPSTLDHIHGILLLSLHELGRYQTNRCWRYSGLASRMICELGLHKDKLFDEEPDTVLSIEKWLLHESRRRAYWTCHMYDVYGAACTGLPMCMHIEDSNVLLPLDIDMLKTADDIYQETFDGSNIVHYRVLRNSMTSLPEGITFSISKSSLFKKRGEVNQMGLTAQITKGNVLLGNIIRSLNRETNVKNPFSFYRLGSDYYLYDKCLTAWAEELPFQYRNTIENLEKYKKMNPVQLTQFFTVHILHYATVALLNRPALLLADILNHDLDPQTKENILHSAQKCTNAANNVTMLLKDSNYVMDRIPVYVAYLVYISGTVVINITQGVYHQNIEHLLEGYLNFLNECRSYWAVADKFYLMIRDLYLMRKNNYDQGRQTASLPSSSASPQEVSASLLNQMDADNQSELVQQENMINSIASNPVLACLSGNFQQQCVDVSGLFLSLSHPLGYTYNDDGSAVSSFDLWLQQQMK